MQLQAVQSRKETFETDVGAFLRETDFCKNLSSVVSVMDFMKRRYSG